MKLKPGLGSYLHVPSGHETDRAGPAVTEVEQSICRVYFRRTPMH